MPEQAIPMRLIGMREDREADKSELGVLEEGRGYT